MKIKKIAFFVFPYLTLLDLVGGYDVLRRVRTMGFDPDVTCHLIGTESEIVDESGFRFLPNGVYENLEPYDLLYVPGGYGIRNLINNKRCIEYLRSWGEIRPIASVCTGSLLLGHADFLRGVPATTHHKAFNMLEGLCHEVVKDKRIVDEGRVVTAAGVSSALDLGLHLVKKFWSGDIHIKIASQMEYDYKISS